MEWSFVLNFLQTRIVVNIDGNFRTVDPRTCSAFDRDFEHFALRHADTQFVLALHVRGFVRRVFRRYRDSFDVNENAVLRLEDDVAVFAVEENVVVGRPNDVFCL